jgi:hypothetical protein
MDFTNARTTTDITQSVKEIKKFVEIQRPMSLIACLDVTEIPLNRERIKIIQGMAAHNRPYVRFIALVGLGFPRSIAFRLILWITGKRNHKVFGTREKALEWLATV